MERKWILSGILCSACLALIFGLNNVKAGMADRFAGKVFVLTKRPPSYFRSKGGFATFLKSHSTKVVYENTNRTWTFDTMAFFRRPLGDYEVEMVFYDVTNGKGKSSRRFVNSFTQYTQDRNTRSLSGKTQLIRPDFDADKHYQIVAQSHGKEIAQGEFHTRGTSQSQIDQEKRMEQMQKDMEKSMRDLEKKAKEQEERNSKANNKAAEDLF